MLQIPKFELETKNNRKGILKTVRKLFALSFELKQNLSRPTFWQETKPKYRTTMAFQKHECFPLNFSTQTCKNCRLVTYLPGCFPPKTCENYAGGLPREIQMSKKNKIKNPLWCDQSNKSLRVEPIGWKGVNFLWGQLKFLIRQTSLVILLGS